VSAAESFIRDGICDMSSNKPDFCSGGPSPTDPPGPTNGPGTQFPSETLEPSNEGSFDGSNEGTNDGRNGIDGCFSDRMTVFEEQKGVVRMDQLSIGDSVKTVDGSFSKVYGFSHKDTAPLSEFFSNQNEYQDGLSPRNDFRAHGLRAQRLHENAHPRSNCQDW